MGNKQDYIKREFCEKIKPQYSWANAATIDNCISPSEDECKTIREIDGKSVTSFPTNTAIKGEGSGCIGNQGIENIKYNTDEEGKERCFQDVDEDGNDENNCVSPAICKNY